MSVAVLLICSYIPQALGQCTDCTVNINGNNPPSSAIVSGSTVCISGERTTAINFNNSSNISICISPHASWNGSALSLSSLSLINNYGNLTVNNSFNSNTWRINNYDILNFNTHLAAGNTINNYSIMRSTVNIQINGTIKLAGTYEVIGDAHVNSTGRIAALNANQCNTMTVHGTFSTNGLITGSKLDYAGTGSGLLLNKMPEGNAAPKLTEGAMVGSCTTVNCVETVSTKASGRTDMIYIYRCSGTFSLPEIVDDQELSGVMLLLVAGGGGGGMGESAGGGGAGSMFESANIELDPGTTYQVIVGKGGIGANHINSQGGKGTPSSFLGFTTIGGGGGGSSSATPSVRNGGEGGSGGGGAAIGEVASNGGAGVGLFVTRGGNALRNNSNVRAGGGGGGASSVGMDGNPPDPGHGGNGRMSTILTDITIPSLPNRFSAGGGGTGRNSSNTPVVQGRGGNVNDDIIGGNGNNLLTGRGEVGRPNTGSGGGAGGGGGGAGATGIVVLRLSFGILPVTYTHLDAAYNHADRKTEIKWSTSKEWENSHFEIERSINDIRNWEKIGEVKGMGWSDEVSDYSFEDQLLLAQGGDYYYRLKQVDFNLEYEYSRVVKVKIPEFYHSVWSVYPNPIYDGEQVYFNVGSTINPKETIKVKVISSQSVVYQFSAASPSEVSMNLQNTISKLPKGLFFIEILYENNRNYIKMLKR